DRFAVGGTAELFRARDLVTGQICLLKLLRRDLSFDPAVSAGFLREIQLALLSDHPNLVRALDRGVHEGADWVAVQFVEGCDLRTLLSHIEKSGAPLAPELALYIAHEVLAGLAFAYGLPDPTGGSMGLVHRDLNPRNILLGHDGRVCVADFGAAVASCSEPTPDEIVGSPGYLSPEQARLEALDGRSDVFAVGCVLYEMLVGETAFDCVGLAEPQLLKMHRRGRIRKLPRRIPYEQRLLVELACAEPREERYPSAAHMRDAVEGVLQPNGSPEPTPSWGARLSALMATVLEDMPAMSGVTVSR
ncbi:MAG: serine/threonine-protein kinase, partial [Myxococcota bacterium]